MANAVFINEFLYRGNADGTSSWHVILGVEVDDGFGGTTLNLKGPMNPEAAIAAGYPLSGVLPLINTAALTSADTAAAQVATLTAQVATLNEQISEAQAEVADLQAQVAALTPAVDPAS